MKRTLLLVVFVFTVFLSLAAFAASKHDARVIAELTQLEHDIAKANVTRDTAFMESTLADELVFTGPDGRVQDKADMVAGLHQPPNPNYKIESVDLQDLRVLPYGNVGVVSGGLLITAATPRGEAANHFRFTSMFVKRQGRWGFVAGQTSFVPK